MSITSISSANSSAGSLTTSSSSGTDTFLTLLLAELQTQDPLSPMDTQAMVTQLSTMEMVAENRATRLSQQFAQATSLIGKTVTWHDPNSGDTQTGTVNGVLRDGSEPHLVVGGAMLSLDDVQRIN